MKLLAYTNGSYRGVVEIPYTPASLDAVIEILMPGENSVISYDRSKVYNSNMTPLYCNGEIKLAENKNGKIVRQFEIVP